MFPWITQWDTNIKADISISYVTGWDKEVFWCYCNVSSQALKTLTHFIPVCLHPFIRTTTRIRSRRHRKTTAAMTGTEDEEEEEEGGHRRNSNWLSFFFPSKALPDSWLHSDLGPGDTKEKAACPSLPRLRQTVDPTAEKWAKFV